VLPRPVVAHTNDLLNDQNYVVATQNFVLEEMVACGCEMWAWVVVDENFAHDSET